MKSKNIFRDEGIHIISEKTAFFLNENLKHIITDRFNLQNLINILVIV